MEKWGKGWGRSGDTGVSVRPPDCCPKVDRNRPGLRGRAGAGYKLLMGRAGWLGRSGRCWRWWGACTWT